jgi:hypothetical protein
MPLRRIGLSNLLVEHTLCSHPLFLSTAKSPEVFFSSRSQVPLGSAAAGSSASVCNNCEAELHTLPFQSRALERDEIELSNLLVATIPSADIPHPTAREIVGSFLCPSKAKLSNISEHCI